MTCSVCAIDFDGFKSKLWKKGKCKTCYNSETYMIKKLGKPETIKNCSTCGVSFTEIRRTAKDLCKRCYSKMTYHIRNNPDNCRGCQLPNPHTGAFCRLCIKKAKGDFIFNIPPTRKTTFGLPIVPDELKQEAMHLLVKHKWGWLTAVDNFKIVNLYLTIFEKDDDLDIYPAPSQINYMLGVFKNLLINT